VPTLVNTRGQHRAMEGCLARGSLTSTAPQGTYPKSGRAAGLPARKTLGAGRRARGLVGSGRASIAVPTNSGAVVQHKQTATVGAPRG